MTSAETNKKLNPWQCFISAYKKFAQFDGRAGRRELLWFLFFFAVFYFVLYLITVIIMLLVDNAPSDSPEMGAFSLELGALLSLIIETLALLSNFPIISLIVRRMHDCNKNGAFFLIPIYGWFVLPLTKGSFGANCFGPEPCAVSDAEEIVSQEIEISSGICKQCEEPVTGNYCRNCGTPVCLKKIDKDYFVSEIKDVLGIPNGIIYTLKKLFIFPGISAREFIKDDRKNLAKPIIYLLFTALLFTVVFNITGHMEAMNTETDDAAVDMVFNWVAENIGYTFLIISFVFAFIIKQFFKRYKYNIFEILVLMCFLNGTLLLMGIIISVIGNFLTSDISELIYTIFVVLIIPVYFNCGVASFFDPRKAINYFKSIFCFLQSLLYCFIIMLIAYQVVITAGVFLN